MYRFQSSVTPFLLNTSESMTFSGVEKWTSDIKNKIIFVIRFMLCVFLSLKETKYQPVCPEIFIIQLFFGVIAWFRILFGVMAWSEAPAWSRDKTKLWRVMRDFKVTTVWWEKFGSHILTIKNLISCPISTLKVFACGSNRFPSSHNGELE